MLSVASACMLLVVLFSCFMFLFAGTPTTSFPFVVALVHVVGINFYLDLIFVRPNSVGKLSSV